MYCMEVSPIVKLIVTDYRTELAVKLDRTMEVVKMSKEGLLPIVNPATA